LLVILLVSFSFLPTVTSVINKELVDVSFGGKTLYVGGTGPGNFSSIQDAIDESVDGDTVFVYAGVYHENVHIYKSICLKGENKDFTFIDCETKGVAVYISSDSTILSDFTINNSNGIYLDNTDFNLIYNNIISNNQVGIRAYNTNRLDIVKNTVFSNSEYGIYVFEGKKTVISENIIQRNKLGLKLWNIQSSQDNYIIGNRFVENMRHVDFQYTWPISSPATYVWFNNYWDNNLESFEYKCIFGRFAFYTVRDSNNEIVRIYSIPWVLFDRSPSNESNI